MDRCPLELWTHIFGLACTDGGLTGCSLALVSHDFREAVLPVQLYSVALCGVDKMSSFLELLTRREPAHRRVRHLFLSSTNGFYCTVPYGTVEEEDNGNGGDEDVDDTLANTNNTDCAVEAKDADIVLLSILDFVAPDLLTLASSLSHRGITPHNIHFVPFPSLTELAMSGGFFYPAPSPHCAQEYFPSLRYLSIPSAYDFVHFFTYRAPILTHLRIPDYSFMSPRLVDYMERFLSGFTLELENPDTPTDLFPPTIQKIAVHDSMHGASPPLGVNRDYSVILALMWGDRKSKLDILSQNPLPHFLKPRGDWEDRITGEYSLWDERKVLVGDTTLPSTTETSSPPTAISTASGTDGLVNQMAGATLAPAQQN